MLAKQYVHRLPSDYDMGLIRARAKLRGSSWDDMAGLIFKAFVSQEKGSVSAAGNVYSSIYLWSDERAAARFLMGPGFQGVIEAFGRPRIETWLPIDARKGPAAGAQMLYRDDIHLAGGPNRVQELEREVIRNRELASLPDTSAVVAGLSVADWSVVRFVLTAGMPEPRPNRCIYEVLYLAQPGLSTLGNDA